MGSGKTFRVEGFGVVGEANLMGFVKTAASKELDDLNVGESCEGAVDRTLFKNQPANKHKPERMRVTRVS